MGDVSAEPSMEEILSSIKRIIAEEGDGVASASRPRRPVRPAPRAEPESEPFDRDEILELSDPVERYDAREELAEEEFAMSMPDAPAPSTSPAEPILSARTAEVSRGSLDALSRLIVKPDVHGSDTLEGVVREMLRPMLREWLDAHLPAMVEDMVSREIGRITGQR